MTSPPILTLGGDFYDPVDPADFPKTILRFRNDAAAKTVGLEALSDADWIRYFGRFEPLPENLKQPLALRYHGHQFQSYNPQLGDGRGFLFAQLEDDHGRWLDLGTKGSGQTPYSRQGDGRLTLKGGVREVLATAYLEALGVPTSKSFSLIETGEQLVRGDEPSPTRSSVLVRLSHSHIRFGSFQRAAYEQRPDNIEKLTLYALENLYKVAPEDDPFSQLLTLTAQKSAETVASWMAGGFVHGVMNTDNMNITGESFDYGPYRFLPTLQGGFTAAYFDHNGLYAFGRQPQVMAWNLSRLGETMLDNIGEEEIVAALETYAPAYKQALREAMLGRMNLALQDEDRDAAFMRATFGFLEDSQGSFPQFFFDVYGGAERFENTRKGANTGHYQGTAFEDWYAVFKTYDPAEPERLTSDYFTGRDRPASLLYDEIEALWAPITDDDEWSIFYAKLDELEQMRLARYG